LAVAAPLPPVVPVVLRLFVPYVAQPVAPRELIRLLELDEALDADELAVEEDAADELLAELEAVDELEAVLLAEEAAEELAALELLTEELAVLLVLEVVVVVLVVELEPPPPPPPPQAVSKAVVSSRQGIPVLVTARILDSFRASIALVIWPPS
jgi:hypothetical protein